MRLPATALTDLATTAGAAPRTVECVGSGRTPRTGGKCLVRFSPGGPSVPAVVEVTLVPAAAA